MDQEMENAASTPDPFAGAARPPSVDPFAPSPVPAETVDAFSTLAPSNGTSDSVPAKLPIGSFVLPASVVSTLGRGDTKSGMAALDRVFGTAQKSAPMGILESSLSDGEYVISPTKVAEFGQGDPAKGAEVLSGYFGVPVNPET